MIWHPLTSLTTQAIPHGALLRFAARHPYEDVVDLMVFDPQDYSSGLGLIVASGYKAGLILVLLPPESREKTNSLSANWLIKNWRKWVYPSTNPNSVFVAIHGRPKPRLPVG